MFSVIITRTSDQIIKQCFFNSLREARQYFNRIVRDKPFERGHVRLIEKRNGYQSFLLDIHIIGSTFGRKHKNV